jgi:hypothetical protein
MFTTPAENKASLESYGYEVIEHEKYKPGMRVCGRGEQWYEAQEDGTADIVYVMEKKNSSWSQTYHARDIEIIVMHKDGTPHQWASYGTTIAYNQPEKENVDA